MKRITSILLVLTMLLALTGILAPTETAAASEQSALTAYRDYLASSQRFTTWSDDTFSWGVGNLRYAELIDLDQDGVPELILMFSLQGFSPFASHHTEYGLVVLGYNGRAVELYSGSVVSLGGFSVSYAIAAGTGGRTYFVVNDFDHTEGDITYYLLGSGRFSSSLVLGIDDIENNYYINGARVNYSAFENAPSANLGVTQLRRITVDTTNNVQSVLAEIDRRITQPPITVMLDGRELVFDVPPQMISGRTLVPLRTIFEALGATIDWNGNTQTVTATKDDRVVVLTIGSTTPTVNGSVVTIDQPGIIVNARTLVPLRFVAESFGVSVDWNNDTRTVTITS